MCVCVRAARGHWLGQRPGQLMTAAVMAVIVAVTAAPQSIVKAAMDV